MSQLTVNGIPVDVEYKKIRSMNIYVKAPDGHVKITVPLRTGSQVIEAFLFRHMDWIAAQQKKVRERYPQHTYLSGNTIFLLGAPCVLEVRETEKKRSCGMEREDNRLILTAPLNSTAEQREAILRKWQREQLHAILSGMIPEWSSKLGVLPPEWHIKRMKTKWGTCNHRAKRIWLSLALIEYPTECISYTVLHELVHLLVPNHSARFWELMTEYMPDWKKRRKRLNAVQR